MSKEDRNGILVVSVLIATATYQAALIEICVHLPSGIGYALHLVLPLMICYTLLAMVWWSYFYAVITVVVIFMLVLPKIPSYDQTTI